jgi:hypothetical protein
MVVGLVAALVSAAGLSAAQSVTTNVQIKLSPLVENVKGGQIDWGTEMMYASGEGVMPSAAEESNRARAMLEAKEYAKMQAIANLFQLIEGTSISYSATGKNFMAEDITLKQTIQGYVKNVSIIKTVSLKEEGDTIIKVVVGTPMYGKDTPGSALLSKLSQEELSEPEPAPVKIEIPKEPTRVVKPEPVTPKVEEEKPKPEPVVVAKEPEVKPEEPKPVTPPAPDGPVVEKVKETPTIVAVAVTSGPACTSVIVDTLGFNVMRAMSPKIRTRNGDEVWGTLKMDPDEIQDHGPVAYTRTIADAKKCSRAGSNPLMLKAIGRAGGSRMCDVVLSDDDVTKLKSADQSAKPPFLAAMKVIVVVDPTKAF